MSHDIMRNDLDYYELLMDEDTPAMTWSFFTVGFKMVKEDLKMQSYFAQSHQDYVQDPFKVIKKHVLLFIQLFPFRFGPSTRRAKDKP
jgi:hypothetical protein